MKRGEREKALVCVKAGQEEKLQTGRQSGGFEEERIECFDKDSEKKEQN